MCIRLFVAVVGVDGKWGVVFPKVWVEKAGGTHGGFESFSKQIWAVWVGGPLGLLGFFYLFLEGGKGKGDIFFVSIRVLSARGKVFWGGKRAKEGEIFHSRCEGWSSRVRKEQALIVVEEWVPWRKPPSRRKLPPGPRAAKSWPKPAGQGSSPSRRAKGVGAGGNEFALGAVSGGGRVLNT